MQSFVKQTLFWALILFGATGAWAQTTIDLSEDFTTDVITAHDGDVLTGTLSTNVKISIANNATVTLQDVSINANGGWTTGNYAGITCEGDATLILVGTNTVKGFNQDYPGIYVPGDKDTPNNNKTLTIQGSGSLKASSNGNGAGIGGGSNINCGNIVIAGGTITATGKEANAGIGVGYEASCGTISITGGTVNATGSLYGSGIGTGYGGSCGAITISGGFVTANGGGYAAGIGAGYHNASCVSIDITGGTVTATGGTKAAGIGTGQESSCGPITITDGVTQVTATKGGNAPNSIGAGWQSDCGTVTIGGVEYWINSQYLNGGDDAQTGIVKSPYYYPIPNHTLDNIPSNWTVTANGQPVQVTPYESPNQDKGYASIPVDAEVVLTPTLSEKPRMKSVTLIDPLTIPLTFEAKVAPAKVVFTEGENMTLKPLLYSINGGNWAEYTFGDTITIADSAAKVSFRGTNAAYALYSEGDGASHFSCTADCYVYGNIMSLIDSVNFATTTALTSDNTFCSLFINNSHIYNHATKSLELPAMILKEYCYASMFKGCTNLTSAPALPAMTMANLCYLNMFQGCTSLTAAPVLPAMNLAGYCYEGMFEGCTNLTSAPALPAMNLAGYCYEGMFEGCTSLATAPALPATTLESGCYFGMFFNCSSLTTAPTLPAETLANSCYSVMFKGCTSLQTAPALPATTLSEHCYWAMFENCTNLTTAPALPAETLADECYYYMFSGCTSLTTAPILPAQTLIHGCYSHMFNGCSLLNSVTCLATDISAQYCTANWLLDVAQTGTFIKPAAVNWGDPGPSTIPVGWTTTPYETFLPLTFEANVAGATVTFTKAQILSITTVEYSTDGTNWTTYTDPIILTNVGDKVSFRGNNAKYAKDDIFHSNFSCSAGCYIYGNIMSLINKDNFATNTTLTEENTFNRLFQDNSNISNHPTKPLVLPATTLTSRCYLNMFSGCTSLTTAPALPATTLKGYCYAHMFSGCTSLTTAPALPATTLAMNCYNSMFKDCTGLTTAPALPATKLSYYSYSYMFWGCTNLNSVTCLATDISAQHCTENWLNNVAATGTFIKPASMNDWTLNSPDGIPVGWTAIPVVPGKFSVNADGDQIYFSQGNLQATTSDHGANWTWSFATNQWDYIGNAEANTSINGDGTVSTNGTVDLFGWVGASSTWTGAAQYGISNATTTNSTYTYGNVADEALKSDWGNNIDSSWRTLTIDEWQYLFNTRASGSTVNGTSNARYTHATINGVNGIILFPDGVTIANNEATQWGAINGTSAWGTQCTSDQWTALAAKGCVFLPAAGDRFNGTSISSAGDQGLYWSSTSYTTDSDPAYCIKFGSNSLITNESYYRFYGLSVRLVRDAN